MAGVLWKEFEQQELADKPLDLSRSLDLSAPLGLNPDQKKLKFSDSKAYKSGAAGHQARLRVKDAIESDQQFQAVWLTHRSAEEVDQAVEKKQLNLLERSMAEEIIEQLPNFDRAILDGASIFRPLTQVALKTEAKKNLSDEGVMARPCELLALDKADQNYPAVAAASIFAKVARDQALLEEFAKLPARFHPYVWQGGGYPNARTLNFIFAYYKDFGKLPSFLRLSYRWGALDQLKKEL